jgi:hypothetical protein
MSWRGGGFEKIKPGWGSESCTFQTRERDRGKKTVGKPGGDRVVVSSTRSLSRLGELLERKPYIRKEVNKTTIEVLATIL